MEENEINQDSSPTDSMLISCMTLAMNLIYEKGDFYPLLYYFDEGDSVVSSTIDTKLQFDELDQLVKSIANKTGFEDYAYAFNDQVGSRIMMSIHMEGVQYPFQIIDYKFNDDGINFSELYSQE